VICDTVLAGTVQYNVPTTRDGTVQDFSGLSVEVCQLLFSGDFAN